MEHSTPFKVLYISDMDHLVEEGDLWRVFLPWSQSISSIRLIKDITRLMGTSHAYINFVSATDALAAYKSVQPLFLNSSYCRVSPYDGKSLQKNQPRPKQSTGCGLFIKNLDSNVGPSVLWGYFGSFGNIVGCRIAIDDFGISRNFAYLTYETAEEASAALKSMNGKMIGTSRITVTYNVHKNQRVIRLSIKPVISGVATENDTTSKTDKNKEKTKNNSGPSKSFPLTKQQIFETLEPYGPLMTLNMPLNKDNMHSDQAVAVFYPNANPNKAIEEVKQIAGVTVELSFLTGGANKFGNNNTTTTDNDQSSSQPAQLQKHNDDPTNTRSGRVFNVPLKRNEAKDGIASQNDTLPSYRNNFGRHQSLFNERSTKKKGNNIFVRPLYNNVDEQMLNEEFSKYGNVLEAKLIYNEFGNSKGYGFVKYETTEEAEKATHELNGQKLWGNELCIAPALVKNKKTSSRLPPFPRAAFVYPHQLGIHALSQGGAIIGTTPPPLSHHDSHDKPYEQSTSQFPITSVYGHTTAYANMGMYYMPVEYAYDYYPVSVASMPVNPQFNYSASQINSTAQIPKDQHSEGTEEKDIKLYDLEKLGELLIKKVVNFPDINRNKELASVVTGLLLQQKQSDIVEWLKVDAILMKRTKQALDAYNSYMANNKQTQ